MIEAPPRSAQQRLDALDRSAFVRRERAWLKNHLAHHPDDVVTYIARATRVARADAALDAVVRDAVPRPAPRIPRLDAVWDSVGEARRESHPETTRRHHESTLVTCMAEGCILPASKYIANSRFATSINLDRAGWDALARGDYAELCTECFAIATTYHALLAPEPAWLREKYT